MNAICILLMGIGVLAIGAHSGNGAAGSDDLRDLQGMWFTVSLINDGKTIVDADAPPKPGPLTKLSYENDTWKVIVGDKTVASGKFAIDPTKSPKEIDIMDDTGVRNEQTKLGIYKLSDGTYTYCLAPAGKPRPIDFISKPGSGYSLGVSRRGKI